MFRSVAALVIAAVVVPAAAAQETPEPLAAVHTAVRQAIQKCIADREIAGAVTFVTDQRRKLLDSFGKADLADNRPMNADALFWIASMTKPVTGAAVMMMQDEGKLQVDDPVSRSTSPSSPT